MPKRQNRPTPVNNLFPSTYSAATQMAGAPAEQRKPPIAAISHRQVFFYQIAERKTPDRDCRVLDNPLKAGVDVGRSIIIQPKLVTRRRAVMNETTEMQFRDRGNAPNPVAEERDLRWSLRHL